MGVANNYIIIDSCEPTTKNNNNIFSSQIFDPQISELENRICDLERKNEELQKENAVLKGQSLKATNNKLYTQKSFGTIISLPISTESIAEGIYKIRCHTANKGIKCLQAYPRWFNLVGLNRDSLDVDQKWHVKPNKNGQYTISCETRYGGLLYLEAFPRNGNVQVQIQSNSQDQLWRIALVEHQRYTICCATKNKGNMSIEAFPKALLYQVCPHNCQLYQDQQWEFIPVIKAD